MCPRKFKYVIVDEIFPRICSLGNEHKDLVRPHEKATSAGFAKLNVLTGFPLTPNEARLSVDCWGESISLNLKSDPEDYFILERLFSEPA